MEEEEGVVGVQEGAGLFLTMGKQKEVGDTLLEAIIQIIEVDTMVVGEEEGACPFRQEVEALGQIRRCPLTELLLSDGRKFISHFTIAICIP